MFYPIGPDISANKADRSSAWKPPFCGIAIMAKASRPGLTKTRLVPPLTYEEAAFLNTAFLQDVAGTVSTASRMADIAGYAAYGPQNSGDFFREHLPSEITAFECWTGSLTSDLLHAMNRLFENGHGAACVMNSDSPTLPPSILAEAAGALIERPGRLVLGRSSDGGFYFLGARALHPALFEGIEWSTDEVAEHVLSKARGLKLDICELPVWYDVDDVICLQRLIEDLRSARKGFDRAGTTLGEQSWRLLQSWLSDTDFQSRVEAAVEASKVKSARAASIP